MPYTGPDDAKLPASVQKLSKDKREQWVAVFNDAFSRCREDGGKTDECESSAFAQANGVVSEQANEEAAIEMSDPKYEIVTARVNGRTVSFAEALDAWRELNEAKTKTVGGTQYPASAFLVVEDSDMPSTWHLQVMDSAGKPDHRLMDAAWAALFNPNGYRGNKYEGPNKADAGRKLKALYKSEDMETPATESAAMREYSSEPEYQFVGSATSFADLDVQNAAYHYADMLRETTEQFTGMIGNIMWSPDVENKAAALRQLLDEYLARVEMEATTGDEAGMTEADAPGESLTESAEAVIEDVAEAENNGKGCVVTFKLLEPGPGNARDRHYYGSKMLRENAHKFVGAKMFATEHVKDEKNVRTWVSTIEKLAGFSPSGAPIMQAYAHDPAFAQGLRNLKERGLLEKMQNSIHAKGLTAPLTLDGEEYADVREITFVDSVDWVNRAGAGGHALDLIENASGGQPMDELENRDDQQTDEAAEEQEQVEAGVQEADLNEAETSEAEESQPLSVSEVLTALLGADLPRVAQLKLAERTYESAESLQEAITQETAYIQQLKGAQKKGGSGPKVFGLNAAKPATATENEQEDVQERASDESVVNILHRYGVGHS